METAILHEQEYQREQASKAQTAVKGN